MNTEDRFDELLDQWEAARKQGRRLSAKELCRDCPELLGRVREQIQALEWIPSQNPRTGLGDFADPGSVQRGDVLFGRYTLQQNAGRGGYGTVWRAFDRVLERDVALKIPHRFRQSSAARQSVVAEARKLARLKHPRIVRVLDVVEDERHAVIITEFVPGTTLADGISERRFAPSQAADLVARIADGLEHAHQQGFVHRDIKPANILIDEHGEPFLTDFGIAVDTERDTDAAVGAGTVSYMAPEQARGEPVDARTDVFSLGVVLYELLSGNRPFGGDSPAAVRNAIQAADPPSIRISDFSVPLPLETVCFRALSRRPEDRFATARDFADKLRCSVSGQRRQSSAGRALAVSLMLAVTGVWYWLSTRPDSPPPRSSLRVNAVADTAAVHTAERQSVEPAIKTPPAVTVLEAESVLRGHRGRVSSVSWSADNRWLVSGSWDKSVRLWDAKTATFMGIFKGHTEGIGGVAVSPDGMYAASGGGHNYRDSTVRIWDLQTGKQSTLFDQHQHNVMAVAWAPNGEFLVSGSLDNTIRRWEPDSGQQMRLLGVHRRADVNNWDAQVWAVAVSPDSRTVAAGLRDGTVRLIDAATGKQSTSLTGHTDWVTGVDFSRDGAAVASCSRDGTARLYDVRTGQMLREFTPGLDRLNAVRFTSDGQRIVCAGEASDFVMLDVEHGREVVRFAGHTESVRCLAISNDGTIASGSDDATIRVWPAWSSPASEPALGTPSITGAD